jgi:hypothetical protein
VRRWRSPLSSLTILGMLFWLGTAMAPSVSSPQATSTTLAAAPDPSEETGPLLPWPEDWCTAPCPEPPLDPSLDSDDWKPEKEVSHSEPASAPVAARVRAVAPPPAPRPVEEWRLLVSAYFATSDVDLALRVISCESGGDPNAQNPRSGAAGLFQHIPRYWDARTAAIGLPGASIFDPVANVSAAAWLVYTEGWGPWAPSKGCWG